MVPLSLALRDAGHEVAIASADRREEVARLGFSYFEVGLPMAEVLERLKSVFPDWPWGPDLDHVYALIHTNLHAPDAARDLVVAIDEFRPDLVVHEFCEFGAPIASAARGVPCVTHGLGLPMPEALMAEAGRQIARLWESYGLRAPRYGMLDLLYIDPCPPSLDPGDGPQCDHVAIALSQPTQPRSARPRPLIYVTLGTSAAFNRAANLWRTVLDAVGDLDVDVLATIGRANDPAALCEVPPNVTVEQWRDQDEVLPSCSAVVCHGGAGTMLGALAHGVPQLVLPHGADQYRNADAVVRAHAGTTCDPNDSIAVRANIASLVEDTTYAEAASRIAIELAAMPGPADVVDALEALTSRTHAH
jgi:UDP:flavonoid glycosyltransferase YjiC (YdhE family)